MLSCCGFDCNKCPMFIATIKNDEELRNDVINKYGLSQDMKCSGCLSKGICEAGKNCKIRSCCLSKNIRNCGECSAYNNCKDIMLIINTNQESKKNLDEVNEKIINDNK